MASDEKELPRVLVIAATPSACEPVLEGLAGFARATRLGIDQLSQRGRLVDASAAVLVLASPPDADEEEGLAPLRDLAGSLPLVLVTPTDLDLEALRERLQPAAWLPPEPPAAALRLALEQAGVGPETGGGARRQQRRATALIGVSSALREVMQQVSRFAPSRLPVLILGETGTGKELVARAIHEQSRRSGSFVAVNCSALPEALLEVELFGSARGAFTGADRDRIGLFEAASGGTLFLDEIGDVSAPLQAKLLRAVEYQDIRRVGDSTSRPVEARIVCATHRDLEARVAEGAFRQDLLYRINTATIYVPPLRRRRVDIPLLAQHFAEEFGVAHARQIVLDEGFIDSLAEQRFPGNVRELRNLIERAIALTEPGEPVRVPAGARAAGSPPGLPEPVPGSLREAVEDLEERLIQSALVHFSGNRSRVAEALGLSRQGLRNRMQRYGLA